MGDSIGYMYGIDDWITLHTVLTSVLTWKILPLTRPDLRQATSSDDEVSRVSTYSIETDRQTGEAHAIRLHEPIR
jgi:hypothetical protein